MGDQMNLRAGPLEMRYGDGDLRAISVGGREIVRRIYAAVRDRNWGTAPNEIGDVVIAAGPEAFDVSFACENRLNDVDFEWRGAISGAADGTIRYSMDGRARATFLKNRIGFCVLHPAACAGAQCEIEHVDGRHERAVLPRKIIAAQPVAPFENMRVFRQRIAGGAWLEIAFEGDLFEMEDQRNWTDASYKTFSTPLRLPFPVEIPQGAYVRQSIAIRVEGLPKRSRPRPPAHPVITFGDHALPLPRIGLGIPADRPVMRAGAAQRLRDLKLAHLRADLDLAGGALWRDLKRATTSSEQLDLPLELALLVPTEDAEAALLRAREAIQAVGPKIARWLIYRAVERQTESPPIQRLVGLARRHLRDLAPRAPFASGVNTDFMFLNRHPLAATGMDVLTVAINPQVHAFDDASLVETLAAQGTLAKNLQRLARSKPAMISPVTLLPRFNPYATAAVARAAPPADPRQRTAFGACWALGSLKYLAEAGISNLTYFETHGPRGLLDGREVFPVYDLFAVVGAFGGGGVLVSTSTRPLMADALVLRKGRRTCALIANFAEGETEIEVLAAARPQQVDRVVGEKSAPETHTDGRLRLHVAGRSITRVMWK